MLNVFRSRKNGVTQQTTRERTDTDYLRFTQESSRLSFIAVKIIRRRRN